MTLSVDLFRSVRSPCGDLAVDRACTLADRHDLLLWRLRLLATDPS